MEANVERVNGVPVVRINGRLDATTAAPFDSGMSTLTASPEKRILVDLGQVSYVSSAGLRSILQLVKHTAASGGRLGLFSANEQVAEVIEISGFPSLLDIYPDEAAALGACA
jgi:anti-anti-sigma factor